jgi:soluble lytic murein transglycosylase
MRLKEFTNDTVANWRTIAARNNLANPDLILPGQKLDVGDGIVLPKGTTYTVKPGDTLSGIAKNIRKGQIPDTTSSVDKVAQGGPLNPVAAAPASQSEPTSLTNTPATDAELKKRIGADQPIPSYKYKDAAKDQATLDRLKKQDKEKTKQLQNVPKQKSRSPKLPPSTNTGTSEFDRIRDIESGNRDYDDQGRPVVSSKGAKFAAQVMPATSAKPGYGVVPAKDASAQEFNRVGQDYYNAMKKQYGDPTLAAAAYNAGPGRVNSALQRAKTTGRDWKTLLPRETQNYLNKFSGK